MQGNQNTPACRTANNQGYNNPSFFAVNPSLPSPPPPPTHTHAHTHTHTPRLKLESKKTVRTLVEGPRLLGLWWRCPGSSSSGGGAQAGMRQAPATGGQGASQSPQSAAIADSWSVYTAQKSPTQRESTHEFWKAINFSKPKIPGNIYIQWNPEDLLKCLYREASSFQG